MTQRNYTLRQAQGIAFTGQYSYMDDPSTTGVTEGFGLMFYNARMYDPALGRFAQADTIIPGGVQGYDRYAYVSNNPLRYTDPTGHMNDAGTGGGGVSCTVTNTCPNTGGGGGGGSGGNGGQPQADVTEWLVGEMDIEAWWLNEFASCSWLDQVCLYKSHLNMFGDYGKYDIKRSMLNYIGGAVILCQSATCRWVDYSTPGNIMYGYLSASRGVPQPVSWIAAGILEKINSVQDGTPYTGEFSSWGDNPGDKAAVDFGYKLYEKYPNGITVDDFQIALSQETLNTFQAPAVIPNRPAYPTPKNGYTVDYFLWPSTP